MSRFEAGETNGVAVQQLEGLVRTAMFKPANALVGYLLQGAADRIDGSYQPKPGQQRKGREQVTINCILDRSTWSATTTTTKGKRRAIIRPMPRWDWKEPIPRL